MPSGTSFRAARISLLAGLAVLMGACGSPSGESGSRHGAPRQQRPPSPAPVCTTEGDSLGPSEAGIINGTRLSPQARIARGVVLLLTQEKTDASGNAPTAVCTGVLVSPRLVLTAAHCVRTDPGWNSVLRALSTRVIFSADPLCEIGNQGQKMKVFTASEVLVPDDYNASGANENDLALVFLTGLAPMGTAAIPLELEERTYTSETPVFVAGYGRQNDLSEPSEEMDLHLRYAELRPSADTGGPVLRGRALFNQEHGDLLILNADVGTGPCSGDSGGPALILSEGHLSVVGIASFVFDKDLSRLTCQSRAAYTRLDRQRDWLRVQSRGEIP